jgi:hypothetical protein
MENVCWINVVGYVTDKNTNFKPIFYLRTGQNALKMWEVEGAGVSAGAGGGGGNWRWVGLIL